MSAWQAAPSSFESLVGSQGELLSVRISVPWPDLEELLECLAELPFPVNPEIRHGAPTTVVEFPAYSGQIEEIQTAIARVTGQRLRIELRGEWEELTATH